MEEREREEAIEEKNRGRGERRWWQTAARRLPARTNTMCLQHDEDLGGDCAARAATTTTTVEKKARACGGFGKKMAPDDNGEKHEDGGGIGITMGSSGRPECDGNSDVMTTDGEEEGQWWWGISVVER